MFKELRWFFRKHWVKYLLVLVFTIINTLALTITPRIIGEVVNEIANTSLTKDYAIRTFIFMIGIAFVIYLSAVLKQLILGDLGHKLFYELKDRFIRSIFKQDKISLRNIIQWFDSRATGDTNRISRVATHLLFNTIDTIVT